ncbi:MAG: HDOD domain-containing protein [Methylohalobius sp. ZOD2]
MGLLRYFFRSQAGQSRKRQEVAAKPAFERASSIAPDSAPVLPEQLRKLIPCNHLNGSEISLLLPACRSHRYPPGTLLFQQGPSDGAAFYLLDGEVMLVRGEQIRTVSSGSKMAQYPLACGNHYETTATAKTDVTLLSMPESAMLTALENKRAKSIDAAGLSVDFAQLPDILRQSEVFYTFWRTYRENSLTLPTLPQAAIRLRAAMQKEIGVDEGARIIQTDPIVTARLIEIANSPLYSGVTPVATCQQAIARIGLNAARQLVTALTVGRLFQCRQKKVQRQIQSIWRNSVRVSCLSYVLGRHIGGVDPEQALLAGLMSHVGALPFLYFAADFPADLLSENMLAAGVRAVRGGLGIQMLKAWEFPEEMCGIPAFCDDWFYHAPGPTCLTDIVILAHWHALLGRSKTRALPPIEVLPAFQKLDMRQVSPEFSLNLLHNAQQQIEQVRMFFDH